MPSFDIVSEVNSMEIENAVNQAKKELATRFDFKGSTAEILLEKNDIKLSAEDSSKVKTLVEMVMGKLAKRGISLKSVDKGEPEVALRAMFATLGAGPAAVPCLIKGLTNQSPDVRQTAADYLLGEWGAQFPGQQKEAVPLVRELLDDSDENVRITVTNSLKAISAASY